MIWIDLEHKVPTDTDIAGWQPWPKARWEAWLAESKRLLEEVAALDTLGNRGDRNALIDAHSAHWSELKPWLEAISAKKCWFSEVRELFSHYDVEHFRPKKEAKTEGQAVRDGYWWLAFDYMNFRLCGTVGNRKKGGWFPLKEGSEYSTHAHRCEDAEAAYLLDPIDAGDVALLAFDEEGRAVAVPGASEWERKRVTESVKRLKLDEHVTLAEARRKTWQQVTRLIDQFLEAKARCSTGDNAVAKAKMGVAAAWIHRLSRPDEELSAVTKWCVLLRNDRQLSRLVM
jgi:hypothetical protein